MEDELPDEIYRDMLDSVPPLKALIKTHQPELAEDSRYFLMELALWGLVAYQKLSKNRFEEGFQFRDLYGSYISGL